MEKVNYIAHLNAAFERFNNDYKIRQGHITLYLAFFQNGTVSSLKGRLW